MRCDACPVRPDAPHPCLGLIHPPACDKAREDRPGWRALLVRRAEGTHPDEAIDVRLAMLAELCPSGSGPCGCGSAPRLCGREDRPLHVWRTSHCLPCVAPIILGETS